MPKIFVSYRRADTQIMTERIHDRLVQEFGNKNVFLDVDRNIPSGSHFQEIIEDRIEESDILIIIIGAEWLRIMNERADEDEDYVRLEIKTALKKKIIIIPLLVKGARPPLDPLPAEIAQIRNLQIESVRLNPDFHQDMDELVASIRKLVPDYRWISYSLGALLAFALTIITVFILVNESNQPQIPPTETPDVVVAAELTLTAISREQMTSVLETQRANDIETNIAIILQNETNTVEAYTDTPAPTATASNTATATLTPTLTRTPTQDHTATVEAQQTEIAIVTLTSEAQLQTQVVQLTQSFPTITPQPTRTSTNTPTYTPQPTDTSVPTSTSSPTRAPTQTLTPTPNMTATVRVEARLTQTQIANATRVYEQAVATQTANQLDNAFTPVASNADWSPVPQSINGVEMVLVPAGCFDMGLDGIRGEQCFEEPFWLDQYEVTIGQYQQCVDEGGCSPNIRVSANNIYYDDPDYIDYPIVWVSWLEAQEYAGWRGCEIPTETQWEYAVRGPDNLIYPWGNQFDGTLLNFCDTNCEFNWSSGAFDDGYHFEAPVNTYSEGVSWVGAYNLAGNVFEWTASVDESEEAAIYQIVRGGSWFTSIEAIWAYSVDSRPQGNAYNHYGFRLACSLDDVAEFR